MIAGITEALVSYIHSKREATMSPPFELSVEKEKSTGMHGSIKVQKILFQRYKTLLMQRNKKRK